MAETYSEAVRDEILAQQTEHVEPVVLDEEPRWATVALIVASLLIGGLLIYVVWCVFGEVKGLIGGLR